MSSCEAYQTLLSFDAVLMCVELFTFMWTSLHFGVLAIIMGQVSAREGSLSNLGPAPSRHLTNPPCTLGSIDSAAAL